MTPLPAGTVTFLFTDIQGSTPLWERDPHAMQAALAKHNAILEKAIREHGGRVFKVIGDAFQAAFPVPDQAVRAAIATQRALQAGSWDEAGPLRVRMGIHIARAEVRGEDYAVSHDLNRVARITAAGHGGQILLSAPVAELARHHLPKDLNLKDLGEHQLKGMVRPERIYQVAVPDLPAEFPPLASKAAPRHNLPVPPTPLVGRQMEMGDLLARLRREDVRLVTLSGPGGTGKTRLALEAAHRSVSHYPDGVFFISLAPLQNAQLVPDTITAELGVPESQGEPLLETLKAALAKRRLLLLLDNFEHLIVAAPIVAELLAAAPGLNVLVTSRERLRLRGEHEFPLDPLPLPALEKSATSELIQRSPAVTLFLQRAEAVLPSFHLTTENASAVAEICILLDGLPLAIELAAARVKLFSPRNLLDRLEDGFASPGSQSSMRLLASGASDAPARQQTLQNTLEWSYRLLSSAEQALLRRLGVFAGGFTLEAVEAVCYPAAELRDNAYKEISSLLEKSLIQRSDDGSGQARFSMLFVLRQFAFGLLEQAGELPVYNARHAAHFFSLAEQAEPQLITNNRVSWYAILEREHDNLRAALSWAISNRKVETGLRLAGSLWRFWSNQGYLREGHSWLEQVLSLEGMEDVSAELRVNALNGAGWFATCLGDFTAARSYTERCLEIHRRLGDRQAIAGSTGNLGYQLVLQGEFQSAAPLLEESIALFRDTDNRFGLALSLNKLAILAMQQGDYPLAQKLLDESLALMRDQGDLDGISITLSNLGDVALYQRDYDSARRFHEESFKIHQSLGNQLHTSEELGKIGTAFLLQGALVAARSKFEQALKAYEEIGTKQGIPEILEGLAGVAAKRGNPERAVRMFGAAEALHEAIGMPLLPADRAIFDPFVREARTRIGKDDFDRAWSAGRQLLAEGLEAVIDYALDSDAVPDKKTGTTSPCGLTVREVEVLRLVAQGLTDAQVAEQLVISPRTVNAHLTSIYSKMGVNSRAAATRFAVEEGLV